MPPAHAQFIKELRKPPHIRQFGLQFLYYSKSVCVEKSAVSTCKSCGLFVVVDSGDSKLLEAYNNCVSALTNFRSCHLQLVIK